MKYLSFFLVVFLTLSACKKDEPEVNTPVPVDPLANATAQEHLNANESILDILEVFPADSIIGKFYKGGMIFYLNVQDGSGLIASLSDQSIGAEWGCEGTSIFGADSLSLGSGMYNTEDIEVGCNQAGNAANICAFYSNATFIDWYLPNKTELTEMHYSIGVAAFGQNNNIGNFAFDDYWSSNEFDNDQAWAVSFNNGSSNFKLKGETARVRAIRAF